MYRVPGGRDVRVAQAVRTSWAVTLSVWRALILREAVSRLFASRISFVWLFGEPVVHVSYLIFIYTRIRVHSIGGVDAAIWLLIGILGYYQFRKISDHVIAAPEKNRALFAYRQVKPIDAALARAILEGFLGILVLIVLLFLNSLQGHQFAPDDPLGLISALFGLWLLGLGFGLCMTSLFAVVRESRHFYVMAMRPMYLLSGVLFPISPLPHEARAIFMLNPVASGLEMARKSLSSAYVAPPELDPNYLYEFALICFFIGLATNRMVEKRIAAL